ncbi:MAG: hypothetical protein R3237_00665 [Nitrosopumilaceae archaeon]|nr:hypothetical protein [Nitrosopumilaceae archaeon]
MGKTVKFVGAGIIGIVIILAYFYTNIFDLAQPTVEKSVNSAKDVISKVDGKEVVDGAEKISSAIKNETSKIEIKDPFE